MMRTPCKLSLALLVLSLAPTAQALQAEGGEWVSLELPDEAPERWVLSLEWGGEELEVDLWRSPIRASSFRVREMGVDGSLYEVPCTPPATYHGAVRGDTSRGAALAFVEGRLEGFVQGHDGDEIWIERRQADGPVPSEDLHWIHEGVTGGFGLESCRALQPEAEVERVSGPVQELGAGCLHIAELAFDTDHEYYSLHGSTAACAQHIEAVLNAVNFGYARDVLIRHEITEIIVRSSEPDPYSTSGTDGLLDDFVNHWRSQQSGVTRDIAHLMTARPLSSNVIGLAYVGVVCSQDWGYGWTWGQNGLSSETSILGHELGHNWSAPHCLDTDSCVWMCGGCHEFGPITGRQIRDYAAGRACLGTGPGSTAPVPPLASPDEVLGGELVLDVLANDHDGNCDSLFISTFDATTSEGGSVSLSPGTGAGGADELVFTPLTGWEGVETFSYTAMDAAGLTDSAEVTVVLQDDRPEVMTILRLDEGSAVALLDSGPGMTNGSLSGGPNLGVRGARSGTGTALGFDGVDDHGLLPGPRRTDALRLKFSVSVWVQSAGLSTEQILFGNPGSWSVGLQGSRPFIRRTGGADPAPNLSISPGQWTHLVYTFEAGVAARFYVDGVLRGSLGVGGATGSAGDAWYLGSADGTQDFYSGLIDDLHVYDGALTSTQVAYLFANPGSVAVACLTPQVYCVGAPNSVTSQGAGIGWIGTPSIWADEFTLFANNVPSGQFGIFYYGPNQAQVSFGDGFRCVGAGLLGTYRLPVQQADSFGDVYSELDFNSPPANSGGGLIVDGMEWNFQFWYRDPMAQGSGFNLSRALQVEFCP